MTPDDRPLPPPLPVRVRPAAGETAESYIRRLARANHLHPSLLQVYDCPGHGALLPLLRTRGLMQVNGPGACGAYLHARAARATMAGWLVMTARPCCGGPLCPFWTGAGPRGRADGCPLSLPSLPGCRRGRALAAGRRQRALAEWAGAAGFGLVAWGLCTEAPTGAEVLENLAALGGMDDGQRRDFLRKLAAGAPATAATETPAARRVSRFFRGSPCFPGSVDGPRRAVAPAPPAAADGARDRQRSPERRLQRPAGGPGRATAQAEDRRRLSPGRSRIGSPAAGSIG